MTLLALLGPSHRAIDIYVYILLYKVKYKYTLTTIYFRDEINLSFIVPLTGIGHMVGAGIYVLIGTVAKEMAGPAIILSFMLAGAASMLAALCYAEFGTRIPKAGSAYVYTYVSVGEFWAFVIGWNIILEHMIGNKTMLLI